MPCDSLAMRDTRTCGKRRCGVDYSGDMAIEIGRYTVSIHSQKQGNVVDRGDFLPGVATGWFMVHRSGNAGAANCRLLNGKRPNTAKVA